MQDDNNPYAVFFDEMPIRERWSFRERFDWFVDTEIVPLARTAFLLAVVMLLFLITKVFLSAV